MHFRLEILSTFFAVIFLFVAGIVFGSSGRQIRDKLVINKETAAQRALKKRRSDLVERMNNSGIDTDSPIKKGDGLSLSQKLRHVGLPCDAARFRLFCIAAATLVHGILTLMGISSLPCLVIAVLLGLALPFWFVNMLYASKMAKFNDQFIEALDIMIRGVRSGLPVHECYKIIAEQCPSPIKEEFSLLLADVKFGLSMEHVLLKLRTRVPLQSVAFFTTAMNVQLKTGGNLSDILQGLSDLLRGKRTLRGKVRSLSSEVKASAAIMSCAPLLVVGMLSIASPEHIQPLLETPKGHNLIYFIIFWMSLGIAIIRKMINFIKDD